MPDPLLKVENLSVAFETPNGIVHAVNEVSFDLKAGQCLGVVGESGSGKSQTFRAIMGGLSDNGSSTGRVMFKERDLLTMPVAELNKVRGNQIALVVQNSVSGLTPHMKIGRQLAEVLAIHYGTKGEEAEARIMEVMQRVRIPAARKRLNQYPHQLSGGMRQRVLIALALLCEPDILIADEPTTALDVTVESQILDIFDELRRTTNLSIVLITHDLSVLAGRADEVMVMYGGRVFERADVKDFYSHALHPYSRGLLNAMPKINMDVTKELATISGQPPNMLNLPRGCAFAPRCHLAQDKCQAERPSREWIDGQRSVACHFWRQS